MKKLASNVKWNVLTKKLEIDSKIITKLVKVKALNYTHLEIIERITDTERAIGKLQASLEFEGAWTTGQQKKIEKTIEQLEAQLRIWRHKMVTRRA